MVQNYFVPAKEPELASQRSSKRHGASKPWPKPRTKRPRRRTRHKESQEKLQHQEKEGVYNALLQDEKANKQASPELFARRGKGGSRNKDRQRRKAALQATVNEVQAKVEDSILAAGNEPTPTEVWEAVKRERKDLKLASTSHPLSRRKPVHAEEDNDLEFAKAFKQSWEQQRKEEDERHATLSPDARRDARKHVSRASNPT